MFGRGGKLYHLPSKAYERFHTDAIEQLLGVSELIPSPYKIDYLFEMKGKLDSDVDNMMASINDCLQDAGIIDNDKNVLKGSYAKTRGHPEFTCYVDIESV